ncbi:Cytochrome oxidase maturation protein cbb3-type [Stieleria maiorica]|uniref:Cytochrome oxidase maturation protein cbb3-type n=1 Tax=Stieleria maiorica TaxID=2795974 RepID=A0A5B9MK62_9BACT|nr:cbb3-type cytochrome oxidase assembly protein CcoS [Stieleria maiorica]QEG01662.1 Cytochrome oxidase maturation protein cbb3-type [Stieleria maiorica]
MSVLYIALPIALLLGGGGLLACLYCIRDGQYDDLDSPSVRILVDEHRVDDQDARDGPVDEDLSGSNQERV